MTPDTDTRRVTLRELDALVAQTLFGWRLEEETEYDVPGLAAYSPDGMRTWFAETPSGVRSETFPWKGGLPHYSTDWRHTGEALNKAPYSSRIDIDPDGYTSVAINDGSRGTLATAEAATKEAACCLSLLRAYGVEVELETGHD